MEEANNHFSARASNTAVADGLLAQRESALAWRERHLETTPGTKGRYRCLGSAAFSLGCGDSPGQRGVPSSRRGPPDALAHGSKDGATTPPHHERLVAGGAPASTIPNPFSQESDGGSTLLRHWALWATAFPSLRDFALSISGFRRSFRFG
ncbi:hypothetical protein TcCL_NonESM01503 [Trypanosoma cruzi]|nr:hypothetical protein TcCL_NonESM01503 [Trypanosoma cruzi]